MNAESSFAVEEITGIAPKDGHPATIPAIHAPRRSLPSPILPSLGYPDVLAWYTRDVNINDIIKAVYIQMIVPLVSANKGDQLDSYGSTALCDLECLQALSRRIHFGKFVAESKFQSEKELFTKLIKDRDAKGIEKAITKPEVEAKSSTVSNKGYNLWY